MTHREKVGKLKAAIRRAPKSSRVGLRVKAVTMFPLLVYGCRDWLARIR